MDVLGENEALQQFFNGKSPKEHSPDLPRTIFFYVFLSFS